MAEESVVIAGHVMLAVTAPGGAVVARAEGTNMVVDGGRRLLAQLLAGAATTPAFAVVVGIGDGDTTADLTMLYNPDGLSAVAVTPESGAGTVTLQGAFPPAEKQRVIKEAGLMLTCTVGEASQTTLYNRALVKPPQTVRMGEILTLTWTLSFAPQQVVP